jgi:hypothetical protein
MGTVIRWGILGTGQIARTVAQDFRLVPEAVLLAVGSRDQTRAQAFARHHGIAKAYGSYEDLLQDRDIDVVYIATPQMRHRDDALACIGSGKAVLCEKPFTLNAREARTVIQAARRRGVFCMEAMWMRFIPLIREVKTRIDQGAIGDITHLTAEFGNPKPYDPQHRHFNPHLGGGCLLCVRRGGVGERPALRRGRINYEHAVAEIGSGIFQCRQNREIVCRIQQIENRINHLMTHRARNSGVILSNHATAISRNGTPAQPTARQMTAQTKIT